MSTPGAPPLARARALVALAYVVAALVGWLVLRFAPVPDPLWKALAADCAATVAIFAFSFIFSNSSFYDAYWSVAPPLLGAFWLTCAAPDADPLRQGAALLLCSAWGARLTFNWARGWTGLGHEDWRYVDLQAKTGKAYWLVSFLGLHFFPTFQVFLGCVSLYVALGAGGRPWGWLDGVAAAVTAGAIALETVADEQLRRFAGRPGKPAGSVMDEGLWAWSRHPNYLGEMGFWWGLFLFGLAADPSRWRLMLLGPGAISLMFVFVSIPMMEKRQRERKPAFAAYARATPMLLPWFPRKG